MSFESDMKKCIEKTKMRAEYAVTSATIDISSEIMDRTPRDTGRLRGNWTPSINTPSTSQSTNVEPQHGKVKTVANSSFGKVFYLVNNLPYARRIEYEGWSPVKAPQGMVRVSIEGFKQALKKAIK